MKAADVMTRRVITVHPETPVVDAVRVMLQDGLSGLPVVDQEGRLVGMVTEGDFLRRHELGTQPKRRRWIEILIGPNPLAEEYVHTHARKVGDVMRDKVVTVDPGASLDEIVAAMEHNRIKRIPVVRDGQVVGIVSRADLLRALASVSAAGELASRSVDTDRALRERILVELERQPWGREIAVSVVVWDGSVHLWGTITDERRRRALRVLAENIPGVSDVTDHLELTEPMPHYIL